MSKRAIGTNPLTAHGAAVDSYLEPPATLRPKKKPGRPPAGLRPGEKVSDYKRITLWMPPDAKLELETVARFFGRPQWAVVVDAIDALKQAMTPDERKALDVMKRR